MFPIHIVSLGIETPSVLSPSAEHALKKSSVIIGSVRQFTMIEDRQLNAIKIELPTEV